MAITQSTKLYTKDSKKRLSVKELENKPNIIVYSKDHLSGNLIKKRVNEIKLSKRNDDVWKVILTSSSRNDKRYIVVSKDQKFILKNGEEKPLNKLLIGDHLLDPWLFDYKVEKIFYYGYEDTYSIKLDGSDNYFALLQKSLVICLSTK